MAICCYFAFLTWQVVSWEKRKNVLHLATVMFLLVCPTKSPKPKDPIYDYINLRKALNTETEM